MRVRSRSFPRKGLLDLDRRSLLLELLLHVFGLGLGHLFLDRLRRAVHEVLGLLHRSYFASDFSAISPLASPEAPAPLVRPATISPLASPEAPAPLALPRCESTYTSSRCGACSRPTSWASGPWMAPTICARSVSFDGRSARALSPAGSSIWPST